MPRGLVYRIPDATGCGMLYTVYQMPDQWFQYPVVGIGTGLASSLSVIAQSVISRDKPALFDPSSSMAAFIGWKGSVVYRAIAENNFALGRLAMVSAFGYIVSNRKVHFKPH